MTTSGEHDERDSPAATAISRPSLATRSWRALGPVISVVLALWMVRGVAGARPPAGDDVMAHLARVEVGLEVLRGGRLDGWFPRFMLGIDEFLFYGQGFTVVVGAVKALGLGTLSTVGAYKVVTMGAFAATGPSVAFFVHGLGLGHRVAGTAAVIALLVSCPFGGGLHGLYLIGMAPHQVGAVLFFVVLGCVTRTIDDPRWWRRTAFAAAALVVTHLISVMVLAVLLPLLLVPMLATRGRAAVGAVRRLAIAAFAAAGIAAFWLVPAVAFRDQRGIVTTWGTPPLGSRLGEIARTALVYPTSILPSGLERSVVAYVVAGAMPACVVLLRGRRLLAASLAATPLAYLVVAHALASQFQGNSVTLQLANRGLGYAALLALVPVAIVLSAVAGIPAAMVRKRTRSDLADGTASGGRVADAICFSAAAIAVVMLTGDARSVATQQSDAADELRVAARTLTRVVPDGSRFATERAFPEEIAIAGVTHPDYWLAQQSGRSTLNIFNPESTPAGRITFVTEQIATLEPDVLADELARLGTTHVVGIRAETINALVASGRFDPVERNPTDGPFTILEVRGRSSQPTPESGVALPFIGGQAARVVSSRDRLVFDVEPENHGWAEIAVAWSPRWRGTVDGRAVDITATTDGLMRLPVRPGQQEVELRHRPTPWDHVGAAASLIATLVVAAPPAWRTLRRARRR